MDSERIEQEVERFRAAHPDLIARAASDPKFAERWERAIRAKVATDVLGTDRHPGPRRTAQERRDRQLELLAEGRATQAALRKARREREARAAAGAAEAAEIRGSIAHARARDKEQRQLARTLARRDAVRLAHLLQQPERLPPSGPEREAAFRRWVIEEAERRALRTSRRPGP